MRNQYIIQYRVFIEVELAQYKQDQVVDISAMIISLKMMLKLFVWFGGFYRKLLSFFKQFTLKCIRRFQFSLTFSQFFEHFKATFYRYNSSK